MEFTANPAITQNIIQLLQKEYHMEKPLYHMTELIYCLTRSYWDRTEPVPANDTEILLFAVGWGLERLLLKEQRKMESQVVDGISFSPDFLAISDLPGELKTTRISSKKFSVDYMPIGWKKQILGYMHCTSTLEYELTVLHLMGNYSPPFPQIQSFRVTAPLEEVEQNWGWLVTRKMIYMNSHEQHIIPPPRMFCEAYECEHCRYSIRCSATAQAKELVNTSDSEIQ